MRFEGPGTMYPGQTVESLPIQKGATQTDTTTMPEGYAGLRDYMTGGIKSLSGGAKTYAQLQDLYKNPLSSSLFTATVNPLLAAMSPSETAARRSLADTFRKTGQTQSGAYAEQSRMLEGDILGKRNEVVATHAGDIYSRLIQGLNLGLESERAAADPYKLGLDLLTSLRSPGSTSTGTSSYRDLDLEMYDDAQREREANIAAMRNYIQASIGKM